MHQEARRRLRFGWAAAAVGGLAFGSWWLLRDSSSQDGAGPAAARVAAVAGFTKIATTDHYIVVVNVLPAERMFTAEELAQEHPTDGEAMSGGPANPVLPNGRHVEAHIYDRATGLPTTAVTTAIELIVRETGERIDLEPTLMQDVMIGAADVHLGNNTVIEGDQDLTVYVRIGNEEVAVDGHVD